MSTFLNNPMPPALPTDFYQTPVMSHNGRMSLAWVGDCHRFQRLPRGCFRALDYRWSVMRCSHQPVVVGGGGFGNKRQDGTGRANEGGIP